MKDFILISWLKVVTVMVLAGMIFNINHSNAGHVTGGDMQIQCLSPEDSTFEIKVDIFRDCRGINVSPSPIEVKSGCGNINVNLSEQGTHDITPVCDGVCTQCDGGGGGCFQLGVEIFRYTGVVDLSGLMSQGCCEFDIEGFDSCCRDVTVNIENSGSSSYWMEHSFNPCNADGGCPSTPEFHNVPSTTLCKDQDFVFNQGAMTDKGDSLVYELVDPLENQGDPVVYNSPWNKYEPISYFGIYSSVFDRHSSFPRGFHLDAHTGDLKFRPIELMTGIFSIKVSQYRDGNLVSEIRRDIQAEVIDCPQSNNTPEANFEQWNEVCIGEEVNIPIEVVSTDSVFVDWNEGINGAEFSADSGIGSAIGEFSWIPDEQDAKNSIHSFAFKGKDNQCPVPGTISQAVMFDVKDDSIPKANLIKENKDCGQVEFDVELKNINSANYQWEGEDDLYSEEQSFTHHYSEPGQYPVKLTIESAGCETELHDTIEIQEFLSVDAGEDFRICKPDDVNIEASPENEEGTVEYAWNTGSQGQVFDGYIDSDTILIVEATDDAGCKATDSVNIEMIDWEKELEIKNCNELTGYVSVNSEDSVGFKWEVENSIYESDSFVHELSGEGIYSVDLIIDAPGCEATYQDIIEVPEKLEVNLPDTSLCEPGELTLEATTSNAEGEVNFFWDIGAVGPYFTKTFEENETLIVEAADESGCTASDTSKIEVIEWNQEITLENCNELHASASVENDVETDVEWNLWDGISYNEENIVHTIEEPGKYPVSLSINTPSCEFNHTDSVELKEPPKVDLSDATICENDTILIEADITTSTETYDLEWNTGHNEPSFVFWTDRDSVLSLKATDSHGCESTESMQVKTVPKPSEPVITESNDTLYAGTTADHFIWMTNGDTLHQGSSGYFVPSTSDSIQVTAINAGMCSQTSQAYNFTTFLSTPVASKGEVEIYPNPASQELNITTPVSAQNYQITDLSGRTILERSATDNEGTSKTLDISDLEAGTYFIRIKMESGTFTGQWIKEE